MKRAPWRIERSVWPFCPVRLLISVLDAGVWRLSWLWERAHFGAVVSLPGEGCVRPGNADLKYPQNLRLVDGAVFGVGEFSIVVARPVVATSMPACSIAAGVPARVIGTIKTQDEPEDP